MCIDVYVYRCILGGASDFFFFLPSHLELPSQAFCKVESLCSYLGLSSLVIEIDGTWPVLQSSSFTFVSVTCKCSQMPAH